MDLTLPNVAENGWKGLYDSYKWLKLYKNGCKGLVLAGNGLEMDGNGWHWLEMDWTENVTLNTTVICRCMYVK